MSKKTSLGLWMAGRNHRAKYGDSWAKLSADPRMPSLIAKYDLHEADLEILREAIDGIEYPCPLPTDLFPFGKHAGKPYWLVPREYFVWCWRQSMLQQDVKDYMTHRKHWIEKQKLDEEQERNEIIKDLANFTLDL